MNLSSQQQEFLLRVQIGLYEEHELTNFMRKYLITDLQAYWMQDHDLAAEDILNGRFMGSLEPMIQTMFIDWNEKCEIQLFNLR